MSRFRLPIPVRLGDGDFRLAHDLRLRARRRSARLELLAQGQPALSDAERGDLDRLGPRRGLRLGASLVTIGGSTAYSIVVSCTVIFLFFSFAIPIALGLMACGKTWTKMGPWDLGGPIFKLVAVLSILSALLIFFIGVQPPNDWALWITVGFLVLTGIVW